MNKVLVCGSVHYREPQTKGNVFPAATMFGTVTVGESKDTSSDKS
jgi:hypothetical protein